MNQEYTNEDYIHIRLPKHGRGYKTIVFSALILIFGIVHAVWPEVQTPGPEQVKLWLDQDHGAFVAVIGLINLVLRHFTHSSPGYRENTPEPLYKPADTYAEENDRAPWKSDYVPQELNPSEPPLEPLAPPPYVPTNNTPVERSHTQDAIRDNGFTERHKDTGVVVGGYMPPLPVQDVNQTLKEIDDALREADRREKQDT